jgi:hypothetical protein
MSASAAAPRDRLAARVLNAEARATANPTAVAATA